MRGKGSGLGRRGATAVFVAVALAALLGMVSLAVDVGMLMKVRSDAQRAAVSPPAMGLHDRLALLESRLSASELQAVRGDIEAMEARLTQQPKPADSG